MEKKLQRDENSKMIGGVAAGLAEYFDVDVTWVRLAFILAVLAGCSGILAYIILWVAVPAKPFNPFGAGATTANYRVHDDKGFSIPGMEQAYHEKLRKQNNGKFIAGTILIVVGTLFLLRQLDLLPFWVSFRKLWPLFIIFPGVLILAKSTGKKHPVSGPYEGTAATPAEPASETHPDTTPTTEL